MNGTKFGEIVVRGQKFEVIITEAGEFKTELDNEDIKSSSLDALKDRLMKATGTAKKVIAIPFYQWKQEYYGDKGELKHGVVVGIHGSNDNLLVRWDGAGKSEQMSYWGRGNAQLRLTEEEAAAYVRLQKALAQAQQDVAQFEKKHAVNLREEAKLAIAKA